MHANQTKIAWIVYFLGHQGFTEDWEKKLHIIEDILVPCTISAELCPGPPFTFVP